MHTEKHGRHAEQYPASHQSNRSSSVCVGIDSEITRERENVTLQCLKAYCDAYTVTTLRSEIAAYSIVIGPLIKSLLVVSIS